MVEIRHEVFETKSFFSNQVFDRNLNIVECDESTAGTCDTRIQNLASRNAWKIQWDDEAGNAIVPGSSSANSRRNVIGINSVCD